MIAFCGTASAETIWSEDFSSYIDAGITGAGNSGGYPGSITKWSIDVSNCTLSDSADYFMAVDTSGGRMEAVDIDGEAVWTSESISISGYTDVSLSVDTSETGGSANTAKYVHLFYKLNGGAETAFAVNPVSVGDWTSATATQTGLSGSTIQIVARVNNPNAGDKSIFDNVTVSGTPGSPANTSPVLAAIGNQSVTVSNALNFMVSATDINNDIITLSASNLPPGAMFNTVTNAGTVSNSFNWAVAAPTGTYTTTFYADDGTTNDFETITITVSNAPTVNVAPVLAPIGSQSVTNGQALVFSVSASDANSDPLTYIASNLPPGAVFSTNTVPPQFSWSPVGPVGVYTSRFTVADGITNDFEDVVITVNPVPNASPILAPIGNKSLLVGDALSFTVSAADANNDLITLTASNLPPGAVFNTVTNAGAVSNTFNWAVAAPAGTYTPTFTAADGTTNVSETVTISVNEKPRLLISEIADPADLPDSSGAFKFRFVEIYNAGSTSIELTNSSWHLSRQNSGESWSDIELIGTIAVGESFVVAYNAVDFESAYGFAPDLSNSSIAGNGDDVYALYVDGDHDNGILVDIYGVIDEDGTGTAWDYEDSRAVRNNNILEPNTVWTASEWTITAGATTNDMTPRAHGPTPEFQGLEDLFVVLGDDLNLIVTATNAIRPDIITLSATNLPSGATFPNGITGTNSVSGTLFWSAPPAGTYTVTFVAEGLAGTTTKPIDITVYSTTKIDRYFYGWQNDAYADTIVKLENGQFWENTGGSGYTPDQRLRNPDVTITNKLGAYRIVVAGDPNYQTAKLIDIAESTVTNDFSGLGNGAIYQLEDGTNWKQVGWENPSSAADPVTAWRWEKDGKTYIRFLDREDVVIGTTEVISSNPPTSSDIVSRIDGYFRGWSNNRVFALANGEFWQQIVADSSMDTLYRPTATLTNYLGTGTWRLYIDGASAPGYVEVQQLTNVTRTKIDGTFYGFGNGEFFKLQNGEWWRQTSFDTSASTRSNPEILIWNDNGTDYIELPDEGRTASAEQLNVVTESNIIGTFRGLRYAHYYNLANGQEWMQTSFENIPSTADTPDAILWIDENKTMLLARDSNDRNIGDCTVSDPWADDDGDGIINMHEIIAGTSLFDRNDLFMITLGNPNSENRAVLRWVPVSGRIYTIEWTASLLESFQTLEVITDWTQDSWTDVYNEPGTAGFYRVRVQLEN